MNEAEQKTLAEEIAERLNLDLSMNCKWFAPTIAEVIARHFADQPTYTADEVSHAIFRVTGMGVGKLGVILRVLATEHAFKLAAEEDAAQPVPQPATCCEERVLDVGVRRPSQSRPCGNLLPCPAHHGCGQPAEPPAQPTGERCVKCGLPRDPTHHSTQAILDECIAWGKTQHSAGVQHDHPYAPHPPVAPSGDVMRDEE